MATTEARPTRTYPAGWRVRWRTRDGRPRSYQCPDQATAEEIRRQVESEAFWGRDWEPPTRVLVPAPAPAAPAGPTPLRALAEAFVRELAATLAPATAKASASLLEGFVGEMEARYGADVTVAVLTRAELEAYRNARAEVDAPRTLTKRLDTIGRMWRYGAERSDEPGSGITGVGMPKSITTRPAVDGETIAPTWEEVDACIAELEGTAAQRVAIVMRYTGLRIDQVLRLEWPDVDLDGARLRIRPELGKSRAEKRGRTIPISAHLVAELAGWGVRSGPLHPAPGWSTDAPRPVSYDHVYSQLSGRDGQPGAWERAERRGLVRPEAWRAIGRGNGKPAHGFRAALQTELTARRPDLAEAIDAYVGHRLIGGARGHYVDLSTAFAGAWRELVALIPPVSSPAGVLTVRSKTRIA